VKSVGRYAWLAVELETSNNPSVSMIELYDLTRNRRYKNVTGGLYRPTEKPQIWKVTESGVAIFFKEKLCDPMQTECRLSYMEFQPRSFFYFLPPLKSEKLVFSLTTFDTLICLYP
jgi:hypothetical protein